MRYSFGTSTGERVLAFLIRWAILCVAVWAAAKLVGGIHLEGWNATLAVPLILGLLNVYVKPLLVSVCLPLTALTLGLFLVIINAALLLGTGWLAARFGLAFSIDGVGSAVLGAIVISVVAFLLSAALNVERMARKLSRPI